MPKLKSSASSLNLTKPTSSFGNFMGSTGMNIASQALGAIGILEDQMEENKLLQLNLELDQLLIN